MKNDLSTLVIANTLSLVLVLVANFFAGSGMGLQANVGDISRKYDTLFAPSGYAFAIWSVIFLLCIAFVIYQWVQLRKGDPKKYISRTGIWFTLSNMANIAWLYCWLTELLGLSVLVIFFLLFCLCMLTLKLRLELDDEPVFTILFVWWPLVIYLGWIMVASVACVAAWLTSTGWAGGIFSAPTWTIIMLLIATVLYLLLIKNRNMREAAGVGIWAFIAIAVRQWHNHQSISILALVASVVLLGSIAIHGYLQRAYSPAAKIKRGEWT